MGRNFSRCGLKFPLLATVGLSRCGLKLFCWPLWATLPFFFRCRHSVGPWGWVIFLWILRFSFGHQWLIFFCRPLGLLLLIFTFSYVGRCGLFITFWLPTKGRVGVRSASPLSWAILLLGGLSSSAGRCAPGQRGRPRHVFVGRASGSAQTSQARPRPLHSQNGVHLHMAIRLAHGNQARLYCTKRCADNCNYGGDLLSA